uniref:Uncharacterized protein n=1 Tax=Candidatus Kentrum sp. FM TaxID=2126340 RepID=A0A450S4Y9_9GAMM|nr:MAG: hypothetical protein BECKFM1743A_GA0114220_100412 [Candidatus Kentron sp. FM]VFJ47255.1 MAG: hypothetical protein BECKFM1743C_GA0114222_100432 [Candidatus Kentron sp. FM]VFK07163.1 MAG: hypothetical protein BECKFM1743B_GA0114221_1003313 [Candidatus Kentron sp. FM]
MEERHRLAPGDVYRCGSPWRAHQHPTEFTPGRKDEDGMTGAASRMPRAMAPMIQAMASGTRAIARRPRATAQRTRAMAPFPWAMARPIGSMARGARDVARILGIGCEPTCDWAYSPLGGGEKCPRHFIHERHGKTRKEKKDASTTEDAARKTATKDNSTKNNKKNVHGNHGKTRKKDRLSFPCFSVLLSVHFLFFVHVFRTTDLSRKNFVHGRHGKTRKR